VTVQDLLTRALQDLKVYQAGEVLSADDAQLGLVTLNDWIDGLATDGLTVFTITRTTWTITNAASYTIGIGATISVARPTGPEAFHNIGYQDTSISPTLETQQGPVLSEDAYAALPQKTLTNVYPRYWYYNPTFGATGFGTLSPWPVPTSSTLQGVIYVDTPVAEFAAITDTVSLPQGYRRFFRANLAKELAAAFDAQVSPDLQQAAMESRANIKRANSRLIDLSTDAAALFSSALGTSNIYTGP